jgi:hypothetical protein
MGTEKVVVGLLGAALLVGCRPPQGSPGGVSERELADGLQTVLSADREVYTKQVVNRLQNEDKVLKAGEHWKDDKLLPLPAQMFRMGAERAREKTKAFSYSLLSLWPINKQNGAHTDAEKAGLQAVADHPEQNSYTNETVSGVSYLTAVYPDRAVSEACVNCHNNHEDSPRKDFKLGDVMGALVIRVVRR